MPQTADILLISRNNELMRQNCECRYEIELGSANGRSDLQSHKRYTRHKRYIERC